MSIKTIEAPTIPREKQDARTRRQPPYAVVVLNDDEHSFDYVIETFQKVFGYDQRKAFSLAKEIHEKGRTIAWTGTKELAELKKEQIEGMGPDFYARETVNWPLGVELEPLPTT
jgi:ATP-dependent Clp protease adaptor protein ClpS